MDFLKPSLGLYSIITLCILHNFLSVQPPAPANLHFPAPSHYLSATPLPLPRPCPSPRPLLVTTASSCLLRAAVSLVWWVFAVCLLHGGNFDIAATLWLCLGFGFKHSFRIRIRIWMLLFKFHARMRLHLSMLDGWRGLGMVAFDKCQRARQRWMQKSIWRK